MNLSSSYRVKLPSEDLTDKASKIAVIRNRPRDASTSVLGKLFILSTWGEGIDWMAMSASSCWFSVAIVSEMFGICLVTVNESRKCYPKTDEAILPAKNYSLDLAIKAKDTILIPEFIFLVFE